MLKQFTFYSARLHILAAFLAVVMCLPALSLLPPVSMKSPAAISVTKEQSRSTVYVDDGPNVVSAGLTNGTAKLKRSIDVAGAKSAHALYVAALTSYNALRSIGKTSAHYGGVAVRVTGAVIAHVAHGLIDVTVFVVRLPVKIVYTVTKVPVVDAYVRPVEEMNVPEINYAIAIAAAEESRTTKQPGGKKTTEHGHGATRKDSASLWPIRGQVTTLFGVPHWPFQPTHTGMDISSGNASGVTPIKPFRSGMVIEVVHSDYGLGNYVIVDHGKDLTSVYAHLASISVSAGQEVDTNSVLGHEGSTGASTGTHLHFEIRQNGQPVNPQQYINVHP